MSTEGTTQGDPLAIAMYPWLLLHLFVIYIPVIPQFNKFGMLMILLVLVNVLHSGNGEIHFLSWDPCLVIFQMLLKLIL